MVSRFSDRLRVSGYRFLLRRMEHALLYGDVAGEQPVLRPRRSFALGGLLAVVAAGGCAVSALLQTAPAEAPLPSAGLGNPVVAGWSAEPGR
jgi:Type VII secretion system ESX-1, transport TM domain B